MHLDTNFLVGVMLNAVLAAGTWWRCGAPGT
jgi:hypothetical protein